MKKKLQIRIHNIVRLVQQILRFECNSVKILTTGTVLSCAHIAGVARMCMKTFIHKHRPMDSGLDVPSFS